MTGRIHGIHVSDGGVPKRRVAEASVDVEGLAGDRQADLRYHGGPDRAVSLLGLEVIERLAADGHPIAPGSTGENLTLAGLDWAAVVPGARFVFAGGVVLEVVSYASPCSKIAGSFLGGEIQRLSRKVPPGWARVYARVRRDGRIAEGEEVQLVVGPELS